MLRLVVLCLLGMATLSYAGENGVGQAYLSWSPVDLVTKSDSKATEFPVYVRVEGTTDIARLAVRLQWFPSTYSLMSPPASALPPGTAYNVMVAPHDAFGADTAFDATIVFPAHPREQEAIVYWFRYTGSGSPEPANFCLAEVKAMDAAGRIDDLALLDGIRLVGGALLGGCPPARTSIARGELLVQLRSGAAAPDAAQGLQTPRSLMRSPGAADSLTAAGVLSLKRIGGPPAKVRTRNLIGEPILLPPPLELYAAHMKRDVVLRRAAKELSAVSAIARATTDPLVHLYGVPNDPCSSGSGVCIM